MASVAFPQKKEGAFVGEPQVPTTFEWSASETEIPPQRPASPRSLPPPKENAPFQVLFGEHRNTIDAEVVTTTKLTTTQLLQDNVFVIIKTTSIRSGGGICGTMYSNSL